MFILILLFAILTSSNKDYLIAGINANFSRFAKSDFDECDYADYSCNNFLCDILARANSCYPYVVTTRLHADAKCLQVPLARRANMIVFGIDAGHRIINRSTKKCVTVSECLMIGCQIRRDHNQTMWIIYTGKCQS